MKTLKEIKKILGDHHSTLEERFKVKRLSIFGSYARGEQTEESDLDILVEFREPVGFEFLRLARFLEEILQVKVDLVTPDAIKKNRRKYIEKDLIEVEA
ncbi:MAG: nucleotidyltransferase family protein [Calditrichia bacterium]